MSINYSELEKIVSELRDFIIGCFIKNITQYTSNAITIEFRKQAREISLIFYIDPKNTFLGNCYFWDHAPKNPYHFTSVARKHLLGLLVQDFYSEKNDRILHIKFEDYEIIAEFLGKNGNIFLINSDNRILAVLHNRAGEKRVEQTGQTYISLGTKTQKEFSIREQFDLNDSKSLVAQITEYYLKNLAIERILQEKRRLENDIQKKTQLYEKLNEEYKDIDEKLYKETADLLIENINNIDSVADKIKLKIDKNKSISENAQYFYDLYKKQIRKKKQLNEYLSSLKITIDKLYNDIEDLNLKIKKTEIGEIDPIKILKKEDENKLHKNKEKTKSKVENSSLYNILITENGKRIIYGKTSSGNNEILKKFGKGNFWWFHVRDFQGPFVILQDDNLTLDDIKIASTIAVHFSKGKNAGKVSVIYTRCKYVKTIPKAIGKVIYFNEKEILTEDNPQIIKKILIKTKD